MINSLFVNTAILISFLYFASQLMTPQSMDTAPTPFTTVWVGILFGLCGCLLMLNGLQFSNNILIDFRAFALMFSFIFCGWMAGSLSTLVMILFRTCYFGTGIGTHAAIVNFIILFILFALIDEFRLYFRLKYLLMNAVHIFASLVIIQNLLPLSRILHPFSMQYLAAASAVAVILYFILSYIFKTNALYLRLRNESTRDFLTGLYNVRAFDHFLNQATVRAAQSHMPLSLLMIDIDFFKGINDTYGHSSGDLVLKQLGQIITASCRNNDFVSRKGGEEFTVILVDCDDCEAFHIAERIRKNIEIAEFILSKSKKVSVTVSIGISCYPRIIHSPGDLLSSADDALYHAKRSGRNTIKTASFVRDGNEVSG